LRRKKGELKCPKCHDEMMILCRRDPSGFLSKTYYRCLACGYLPEAEGYGPSEKPVRRQARTLPRLKMGNLGWRALTATMLSSIVLVAIMQIPVPVTVFATQTSLDPVKDILPYVSLVNFTESQFTLNYTDGQMTLRVSADYASLMASDSGQNITTLVIVLNKVLLTYQDTHRTLNMGFVSLTMTVKIRYQELIAQIDATTYMPLWTALIDRLTG
jgi:hypothetical protein